MVTKHYHFEEPFAFKRLFWWGVNALVDHRPSPVTLRGGFLPIDEHTDQSKVWNDLALPDVVSTIQHSQFFKFIRGFRFRLAAFYVEFTCDGATPNALSNIVAIVKDAQRAVGTNKSQQTGTSGIATRSASKAIARAGRV